MSQKELHQPTMLPTPETPPGVQACISVRETVAARSQNHSCSRLVRFEVRSGYMLAAKWSSGTIVFRDAKL